MFLTDCPLCDHVNPAGSKFCNACGAPLHLAPCPECGALNNVADPACYKCAADLSSIHNRLTEGRSAAATATDGTSSGVPGATDMTGPGRDAPDAFAQLQEALWRSELPSSESPDEERASAMAPTPEQKHAIAPSPASSAASSLPARPESASILPGAGATSPTRRSVQLVGMLILAVLAGSGLYAFWQRSTSDQSRPPAAAASDQTRAGGLAVGGVISSPGADTVRDAGPDAPREAAAISSTAADTRPQGSGPGAEPVATRPSSGEADAARAIAEHKPPPSVDATVPVVPAARRGGRIVEAPQAAGADAVTAARPPPADRGRGIQRESPSVGPCTEQVAALGLCTLETSQRRE